MPRITDLRRSVAGALLAGVLALTGAVRADNPIVIKVARLHVGDGRVIDHGVVIVEKGKITGVGANLPIPSGADVIDLPAGSVTPGLIDASAQLEPEDVVSRPRPGGPTVNVVALMFNENHKTDGCDWSCSGEPACAFASIHESLEPGQICPCCGYPTMKDFENLASGVERSFSLSESSSEVVPHTRAIDSVNLRSPDFRRLVLGGVTTVFVSPDSSPVIGAQGAIVRTAGPINDRVVVAAADVKAAMGSDSYSIGADNNPPSRFFVSSLTRRPNTRMGVTWVFRKAFYDARKWKDGLEPNGADTPPTEAFPVLDSILAGKIPFRMQARAQNDILTAIRLADEFKLKFTLLEGIESYKCLNELKAHSIPVICGPLFIDPAGMRRFSRDLGDVRLTTVKDLLEAGVPVAISAQDLREEDGLARQAMYAVRAGVSPADALKAVTSTPAKLLGIDKDVGTLESGKRADLVVWSGEPLEATSRPIVVLVGGRTVVDQREPAKK